MDLPVLEFRPGGNGITVMQVVANGSGVRYLSAVRSHDMSVWVDAEHMF
jgi:hypothetical protein